ncbi:MAG: hypothetical protein F6K28_57255 [Microcoleus sp. SIO2G3]|nr:hypothetical protein [Microcoleus sp. SIO2G3]
MANKFQSLLLSGTLAVISIAPCAWVFSGSAAATPIAIAKQNGSAYSLCQAELRRRMGGTRSTVSISVSESIPTATTIRLAGQGTYNRGDGSRSQLFNFSCVVNIPQSRVSSLSYTFRND